MLPSSAALTGKENASAPGRLVVVITRGVVPASKVAEATAEGQAVTRARILANPAQAAAHALAAFDGVCGILAAAESTVMPKRSLTSTGNLFHQRVAATVLCLKLGAVQLLFHGRGLKLRTRPLDAGENE